MKFKVDLTGKKYFRLTVLKHIGFDKRNSSTWLCQCDCGNEKILVGTHFTTGVVKSCGCLQIEMLKNRSITHGKRKCPEYISWAQMKARCLNKKNPAYKDYGERGITVCSQWLNSFENFLADMGQKPSPKHSLDRYPNNDGIYEPENCRWATKREQADNRRSNSWVEYNGYKIRMGDLAIMVGMKKNLLKERIRRGRSAEEAINFCSKQGQH